MNLKHKELLDKHKWLIESEAKKHATHLPGHIVLAEAYHLAHQAAESFDEKKDTKFSTHLTNQLQKLSRLSTTYGQPVRAPENTQYKINKLNAVEQHLESELGRKPTAQELATAAGIGLHDVNAALSSKKNFISVAELGDHHFFTDTSHSMDDWIHFVYHDLSPQDKLIFEYRTGFGGKPLLKTVADIAKKIGTTEAVVNKRLKIIIEMLNKGK